MSSSAQSPQSQASSLVSVEDGKNGKEYHVKMGGKAEISNVGEVLEMAVNGCIGIVAYRQWYAYGIHLEPADEDETREQLREFVKMIKWEEVTKIYIIRPHIAPEHELKAIRESFDGMDVDITWSIYPALLTDDDSDYKQEIKATMVKDVGITIEEIGGEQ